ncbi:MAG: GDSL-type esterase/lipase family protein [Chloroflexota bacterium]|nr:GDSL-type esterase/lipase family protein [Chloroflexota bacterium]
MMRQFIQFVTVMVLCFSLSAMAQELPSPFMTSAFENLNVREGPGTTYLTAARLRTGVQVRIVERNSIGTWVRVQQTLVDGTLFLDGWVLSGLLTLNPELRFSEVPVTALPDGLPENAESPSLRPLYAVPVIPAVSPDMRAVYQRGLEGRQYTHVITKIGDSVSADTLYLTPMSRPGADLGAFDYLRDSLNFFGASTQVESVAARLGMNSYAVFDPMWANSDLCQQGESPLICELRRKKPSVALIMFGGNDVLHMDDAEYSVQIRRLVDETLAEGVIPVLSTFSAHPNLPLWGQSIAFNTRLVEIAAEYQIPLINLWLAARPLYDYGLEADGIHMKHWGTETLRLDDSFPAYSGAALRNLLALRMLDEIRRTVFLDATAIG